MTPGEESIWLAGLLEGEGCFGMRRNSHRGVYPTVTLEMTDEDVVRRVREMLGGSFLSRERANNWKTIYVWRLSGAPAVALMKRILPYMGARRSERICQIIGDYHESRLSICCWCGEEFAQPEPMRGPRRVACSVDCYRHHSRQYMTAWLAANRPRKAAA